VKNHRGNPYCGITRLPSSNGSKDKTTPNKSHFFSFNQSEANNHRGHSCSGLRFYWQPIEAKKVKMKPRLIRRYCFNQPIRGRQSYFCGPAYCVLIVSQWKQRSYSWNHAYQVTIILRPLLLRSISQWKQRTQKDETTPTKAPFSFNQCEPMNHFRGPTYLLRSPWANENRDRKDEITPNELLSF
jgi:hypothetical protein